MVNPKKKKNNKKKKIGKFYEVVFKGKQKYCLLFDHTKEIAKLGQNFESTANQAPNIP